MISVFLVISHKHESSTEHVRYTLGFKQLKSDVMLFKDNSSLFKNRKKFKK